MNNGQELRTDDASTLPDLRAAEWGQRAVHEVYADEVRKADGTGQTFLGHKGSTIVAKDGALVNTDSEPLLSSNSQHRYEDKSERIFLGKFTTIRHWSEEIKDPEKLRALLKPAEVVAESGSKVLAVESNVFAGFGSYVQAGSKSQVEAYEGSTVRAQYGSKVSARNGARVLAESGAQVTAYDGSRVIASEGSRVNAMPNSEIVAKRGSVVTLVAPDDNFEYDRVKLTAEKGARVHVADPFLLLDPAIKADVWFSGNKIEAQEFRRGNPNLTFTTPDYRTAADRIAGTDFKSSSGTEPEPHRRVKRPANLEPFKPGRSLTDEILGVNQVNVPKK